jgi:uncharacterized protein (TIGR03067 family)
VRTVSLSILVLVVASAAVAVAAPVPKAVKKQDDAKRLEGQWVSVTSDGGSGHRPDTSFWLIVDADKMWMGTGTPSRATPEYGFTLDPSQSPKHLNLTSTALGRQEWIYEIDGDTLTWCHPSTGDERPTGMKSDKPYYCTVWNRVKE